MKIKSVILSGLLTIAVVVGSFGMGVEAANVQGISAEEVESVYNIEVDSNTLGSWPTGPQIYSESGIVMNMDSGAILYAKNIDEQHYPASITKLMTALVAFQNYEMDETVTFTWDDIGFLEYGDAHIGIKPDEQLIMEDCLYGMLLASANEVSHAIGAHMEEGYDAFIEEMNETARELGCQNTNWVNTNGLHDEEHYTSARDMALIGSAVFQYEKFREITNTKQHTIGVTNITDETRTFQQNHDMIWQGSSRYYEHCVGGKTGYTDQALTTLVTFATKDDTNLVAVVLRTHGGGKNAYEDTRQMLDYAFNNFSKVTLTEEQVGNTNIEKLEEGAYVVLPEGVTFDNLESTIKEPTELGDKTLTITYTYEGQEVGSVDATITDEYYNEIHGIEEKENDIEDQKEKSEMPVAVKIVLGVVIAVVVMLLVFLCYLLYRRKKSGTRRNKRRRKRRNRPQNTKFN